MMNGEEIGWIKSQLKDKFSKGPYVGSALVYGALSSQLDKYLYEIVYEMCRIDQTIKNVIWICTQNSAKRTRDKVSEQGYDITKLVDNFWFIDAVSDSLKLPRDEKNAIYCNSPTSHRCIFSSVEDMVNENGRSLIVYDNLNASILHYDSPNALLRVLSMANNAIPEKNCIALYMLAKGAADSQTETEIQAIMDTIFKVDEGIKVVPSIGTDKYKRWYNLKWDDLKIITWRDTFSFERPLMYILLLTLIIANLYLTLLVVRVSVITG